MKNTKKGRIASLGLALFMGVSSVFGTSVSAVSAQESELSNEEKAREIVSQMSLEEKIGQKLMLSFRSGWTMRDGTSVSAVTRINDEIYDIIGTYDIGSVILFAANFDADATVNVELTDGLQRAAMDESLGENSIPLMIGADQEGGIVYRLTGGTALPGNMALGATGDTQNAVMAGEIIGSELSAVGVNANFGPVADVNNNANNPVIGLRSFSSDPQIAAEFTQAYIEGVHSQNVATTAKHFPGHGNVTTDSHTGLPSIGSTLDELRQVELVPFQAAIDAGTDMIMTAHIQFPNAFSETIYSDLQDEWISPPATMSRAILTDLLRGEMGFDGVIVTDSMTMDAVANYFDVNERNLLAVQAGVDILDIPFNDMSSWADMENKLIPLIDAFVQAYTEEDGYNGITLSQDELDESVTRILKMKLDRGIMDLSEDYRTLEEKQAAAAATVGSVEHRETERLISANAVTVVKNDNAVLPLKLDENSRVLFASTYSRNNNRFVLAWERAKQAGLIPEGADYKILQHYNWTGLGDQVNSAINSDGTNFSGTNQDLLDWCTVLVHASEISSASNIDGYRVACPQLFINYCEGQGKETVAISLNQPYDVQAFSEADAIVAVYGTTSAGVDITESFGGGTVSATAAFSPNLTAGVEVILGTFGASGKLPVDIPRYISGTGTYSDEIVYQLGYGLTYDSLVSDPDKSSLQTLVDQVNALDLNAYTPESVAAAETQINTMNEALTDANNTLLTHKLAQSVVDAMTTELQDSYDAVMAVLEAQQTDTAASEAALQALQNMVDKANALGSEDETLNAAIANAQAVLDKDAPTATEVVTALLDLSEAMQALNTEENEDALRADVQATIDFINANILTNVDNVRPGKVDALKAAVEVAQTVVDDPEATADELKAANEAMTKVAQELWEIVTKAELEALIESANGYLDGDYTAESIAILQDTITNAQAVADNDDATTNEVTEAITNLANAIAGLEKITLDTSALEHEIALVTEMVANIDDYVPSTVEGLADKLAAAQAAMNATTQDEIDAATATLREARLNARTKADVSALEEIIAYANTLSLSDYTERSVMTLNVAIAKNEALLTDPEVTPAQVDEAVAEIQKAIDGLVPVSVESVTPDTGNAITDNAASSQSTTAVPTNTAASETSSMMFALMIAAGAAACTVYRRKRS